MKPGGSYGGQAKYSARQFMKMYQKYGGKRQGFQSGGMVQALGRAVAPTVMHFFEQSGVENQRMVQQEQPQVVNMGGGGGDPQGLTVILQEVQPTHLQLGIQRQLSSVNVLQVPSFL